MKNLDLFLRRIPKSFVCLSLILFLTLLFSGCEDNPTELEDYDPEPVLSAFLENGEALEEIWLERVAPLEGVYDPLDHGITGADVRIFGGGDTLRMVDDPQKPGRYVPETGMELIPRDWVEYRIEITTLQDEFLWAETVMPLKLDTVAVVLADEEGNIFPVTEGDALNRNMPNMFWMWETDTAHGFIGQITNLRDLDELVPLDPDWDPNDPDDELEIAQKGRHGFTIMRHDARVITIPWVFFRWEGPTLIELYSISDDYWQYLFTLMRTYQGLIANIHTNVHGGLGIFGARAGQGFEVYMKKVEPIE